MTAGQFLRLRQSGSENQQVRAWVSAAQNGDEQSWEQLYRLFYPRMIGYVRLRLDTDRASDAVSEAIARAVGGIEKFTWQKSGFEGWLFRILHNVIVDMHRHHNRAHMFERRQTATVADEEIDDHLLAGEEAVALRRAFALLPEADRTVLALRVIAGLSSEQVGEVLQRKPGTVRMAQARAIDRLRELMGEGLK